jgi:hypothetical protein
MVTYNEWTEAVHTAYKQMGGTYTEGTAPDLTEQAAAFWEANKEQLLELAFAAAVEVAKQALA